jgi:glutamate-1-semialdehyde 2,1-aminomutase
MLLKKKNKSLILNEGYESNKFFFDSGVGSNIFIGRKKYLDLSFSAGSLLLGHNSSIYNRSIKNITKKNLSSLASPNKQANDFANIIKKVFPQYTKFIFCNSGTDAITKSLRICNALTKKNKIIAVTGSWHGSVGQLLFSANKKLKPISLSDGLQKENKKNIKFIPYNDIKKSEKILRKHKSEISCVIIEPIQGCLPLKNSKTYLRFLYKFCKKNKILLVFDEMITGLRVDGKSVQSYFNIKPDISTFGKCFGGGMPIGIIGISSKVEKLIKKNKKRIFFGGTFSGNSISSYVGMMTTKYIIENKNKIFPDLEKKSYFFQNELNKFIKANSIDAHVYRFKSILRIIFTKKEVTNRIQRDFLEFKNIKNINKLRNYLFKNKIYYPSSGIIFMSTSSSNSDIKLLIKFFKIGLKSFF